MTRKELIERLMNVAENYKAGYLFDADLPNDIGVLVDEYTETVAKNSSIPDVSQQRELLLAMGREVLENTHTGFQMRLEDIADGIIANNCG